MRPLIATRATLRQEVLSSRIDVVQGRAMLVGSNGPEAIRRGDSKRSQGDCHLEIAAGCQARVSLTGVMNLDVFGPSAVEWRQGEAGVTLVFHELGWADVDVRAGHHVLELPADWRAQFGRGSFHLRSLSGGPTELRHNAGAAISLEWRGDAAHVRPPVSVYAGSSVRLDRPRYHRVESQSASQDPGQAWRRDDRAEWPWRDRADRPEDALERKVLRGETQVLDELPGVDRGQVARVRTFEADGSSQVLPLKRRRTQGQTYAQVPVAPGELEKPPIVEFATRPGSSLPSATRLPRRPDTDGPRSLTAGPGSGAAPGSVSGAAGGGPDKAVLVELPKVPFDKAQWRGLERRTLNGIGEVAAERGSGVELRVLGGGRVKVFVSASSPSPRWCFAPGKDFLMHPGAVAVFEKSGELRMGFGDIEEKAPLGGRPSFSQLEPRR